MPDHRHPWALGVAFATLLAAGCMEAGTPPVDREAFPSGVYYAQPQVEDTARLATLDGPVSGVGAFGGVGFDLRSDAFLTSRGRSAFEVTAPRGDRQGVDLDGVFHVGRPSFSGDGGHVAFQAVDHEVLGQGPEDDFNIYMADLGTGATTRLSPEPVNEESPEWVPGRAWVAWTSFDPQRTVDLVVWDVEAGIEALRIADGGGLHLAVSNDGQHILESGRMRIYSLPDGELEADLQAKVLEGLAALGYAPDARFPGQAHRGTLPLDGDFSPDGSRIVFDGAVTKDGAYGVIIADMAIDGSDLRVLTPMIDADPARSNQHNFSQLNPTWL